MNDIIPTDQPIMFKREFQILHIRLQTLTTIKKIAETYGYDFNNKHSYTKMKNFLINKGITAVYNRAGYPKVELTE